MLRGCMKLQGLTELQGAMFYFLDKNLYVRVCGSQLKEVNVVLVAVEWMLRTVLWSIKPQLPLMMMMQFFEVDVSFLSFLSLVDDVQSYLLVFILYLFSTKFLIYVFPCTGRDHIWPNVVVMPLYEILEKSGNLKAVREESVKIAKSGKMCSSYVGVSYCTYKAK